MKILAFVISCDKFQYVCIVEIYREFTEPVLNCLLHFFVTTFARAAQKLLQVCEEMKMTWSHVRTLGRMKKKRSQAKAASSACMLVVVTFWMTIKLILHFMSNDTFYTLFLLIW
jgi:hypothetical protein